MLLRPFFLVFLLSGACAAPGGAGSDAGPAPADRDFEVVVLEHRSAEELIPLVRSAVGARPELQIQADPGRNAVLIAGTRNQVDLVRILLAELDDPAAS